MSCDTFASISCDALRHNLVRVRAFAPNSKVLAMIKSNGYGHGLIEVAQALSQADGFGVAHLDRAIALRKAGCSKRILIMCGFRNSEELQLVSRYELAVVVHTQLQLELLAQAQLKLPVKVWLKIDTGMHRLGFAVSELDGALRFLSDIAAVVKPVTVMTHFAEADDTASMTTSNQLELFQAATAGLTVPLSMANSAAIIACSDAHADWVRPGVMLYGVSPFADKVGSDFGLKPVMTLQSTLIAIKEVEKGARVGYGGTWSADGCRRLGVVAMGYGSGYPRHAKSGTPVLVNGKICALAGRVSMDMMSVDITEVESAQIGDRVILWGDGLPIERVAAHADTIPYELLCSVGDKIPYCYT